MLHIYYIYIYVVNVFVVNKRGKQKHFEVTGQKDKI